MAAQRWADLLIPGTATLRNLHDRTPHQPMGTPDQGRLTFLEEHFAAQRLSELARAPLAGPLDYDYMKRIHAHLFSDTYEWAGQERTVPENDVMMSKQAPSVLSAGPRTLAYTYYRVRDIAPAAQAAYKALADEDHLKGLRRAKFVDGLARHWAKINHIHSFREGNTRSQFEFFRVLSADAGWSLDTSAYRQGSLRQAFVNGRYYFQVTGDHRRLARALDVAVTTPHVDKARSGITARFGLSSSQQLPHPDVMNRAHPAHQPTVLPAPPSRGTGITR